jgi:hypothetical protein
MNLRKKIVFALVLSITLSFFVVTQSNATHIFCKIIDYDGKPISGVLMWYKAGGEMIRIRNSLPKGGMASIGNLWGIGRGYGIQTGVRINYNGNFDPREDSTGRYVREWPVRITIILTKEGYEPWEYSDTIPYNAYIVGGRVFTIFLKKMTSSPGYKQRKQKARIPQTRQKIIERDGSRRWTLYGQCHCMPCTAIFWVDGRTVGMVGYGNKDQLGRFEGAHRVTVGKECDGKVTRLSDFEINSPSADDIFVILNSDCMSGKVR